MGFKSPWKPQKKSFSKFFYVLHNCFFTKPKQFSSLILPKQHKYSVTGICIILYTVT